MESETITFIFITAIVCTVYNQQQSTQSSSSSSSSAIVANVHKYIRLGHGNYFRVTTALCHLTAVVLCRQVFKSCCGKKCCVVREVVVLWILYCCGIILYSVVKFLSWCINCKLLWEKLLWEKVLCRRKSCCVVAYFYVGTYGPPYHCHSNAIIKRCNWVKLHRHR